MADPYHYLDDAAKKVIEQDAEARLEWFQGQNIWIPYPQATAILKALSKLVKKPRHHRMPGKLTISASNNGKSRLAMECLARHPMDPNEEGDHVRIAVFLLEIPPHPDEASLLDSILKSLNQPFRRHDPITDKREHVIRLFQQCELRLLLVDELQRILGSRTDMRRVVLDALRYIANRVPVPIAAFSTERGASALASSDEMINRLPSEVIAPWGLDGDFRQLIANFERLLPLRERSKLTTKVMVSLIHTMSEGLIGEVRDLLELALEKAFEKNVERIDEDILREIQWTPPSQRKKMVGVPGKIR